MINDYPLRRTDAPLKVIEWYDIQDDDDWNEPGAEGFYAAHMVSAGWLIGEDKHVVIIARSYSEDENTWHEKRAIPKGTIIQMVDYAEMSSVRHRRRRNQDEADLPELPGSDV